MSLNVKARVGPGKRNERKIPTHFLLSFSSFLLSFFFLIFSSSLTFPLFFLSFLSFSFIFFLLSPSFLSHLLSSYYLFFFIFSSLFLSFLSSCPLSLSLSSSSLFLFFLSSQTTVSVFPLKDKQKSRECLSSLLPLAGNVTTRSGRACAPCLFWNSF